MIAGYHHDDLLVPADHAPEVACRCSPICRVAQDRDRASGLRLGHPAGARSRTPERPLHTLGGSGHGAGGAAGNTGRCIHGDAYVPASMPGRTGVRGQRKAVIGVSTLRLRSVNPPRFGVSDRSVRTSAWANTIVTQALPAQITTGVPRRSFLVRRAGVVDQLSDLHEVDRGFDAVQAGHSLSQLL